MGVIKIPQETTPTSKPATVTIDRRSSDYLLGRRMSTTLADMLMMHDGGYTEGDVINYWVQLAGICHG